MQAIDTGDLPGLGPEMRPTAQPGAAIGQAVTALGLSGETTGLAKAAALMDGCPSPALGLPSGGDDSPCNPRATVPA